MSDLEVISRQYQDLVQGLGLLELLGGGEWRWFNRQMRSVAIASEDLWSAPHRHSGGTSLPCSVLQHRSKWLLEDRNSRARDGQLKERDTLAWTLIGVVTFGTFAVVCLPILIAAYHAKAHSKVGGPLGRHGDGTGTLTRPHALRNLDLVVIGVYGEGRRGHRHHRHQPESAKGSIARGVETMAGSANPPASMSAIDFSVCAIAWRA